MKAPESHQDQGTSAVVVEPASNWGDTAGRVIVKRQQDYWCRPAWRLFRRTPTLRRELRGLQAWRRLGLPVPSVVAYQESGLQAELVVSEIPDALALHRALAQAPTRRGLIVRNVARAIARLHRAGWSHGALYSSHILVGPGPDYAVTFIDLQKARRGRARQPDDLERFWRRNPGLLTPSETDLFRRHYASVMNARAQP